MFARCLWIYIVYGITAVCLADEPKPGSATVAQDRTVVETLLRLKGVDVNASPKWKDAVLRYLETVKGTPRFLDIVEKLKVRGVEDELFRLATDDPSSTAGAKAAGLLIKSGETDRFFAAVRGDNETLAMKAAAALGSAPDDKIVTLLEDIVTDEKRPGTVRVAAVNAIGRNRQGQQFLLELARQGNVPADLTFSVANALLGSADVSIRTEAARHVALPAAADAKPLPPIAELMKMPGDSRRGQQVFQTTGTCSKCHKVRDEGKEIGPDLTEIGSKLSKDAFFVSILDPNAGISHNYETYIVATTSGNVWTGLMVNRTEQSVAIRTNEGVDKEIPTLDIEELTKSKTSLMPADLQKLMSVQDLVDVVAYLMTLKKNG